MYDNEDSAPRVQDGNMGGLQVQFGMQMLISHSKPCVGETARKDANNLAIVRRGQHLNAGDPFDPFKATPTWGD